MALRSVAKRQALLFGQLRQAACAARAYAAAGEQQVICAKPLLLLRCLLSSSKTLHTQKMMWQRGQFAKHVLEALDVCASLISSATATPVRAATPTNTATLRPSLCVSPSPHPPTHHAPTHHTRMWL